jgi:hypothetical protein
LDADGIGGVKLQRVGRKDIGVPPLVKTPLHPRLYGKSRREIIRQGLVEGNLYPRAAGYFEGIIAGGGKYDPENVRCLKGMGGGGITRGLVKEIVYPVVVQGFPEG